MVVDSSEGCGLLGIPFLRSFLRFSSYQQTSGIIDFVGLSLRPLLDLDTTALGICQIEQDLP
jgi:hypothetical protein